MSAHPDSVDRTGFGLPVGPSILQNLTRAVSLALQPDPSSVEAAALWIRTAHLLGFPAEPYGVALTVTDKQSQRRVMIGTAAGDEAQSSSSPGVTIPRPGWDGAGHVVAYVPRHKLLVDPALTLVCAHGIDSPPLLATVRTKNTRDGQWHFDSPDLDIVYKPVPSDGSWREVYRQNHEVHAETAHALAEALESGIRPDDIIWS